MIRILDNTEEYVAVFLIIVLGLMLSSQIILRYVFEMGFTWIEEIARVIFIWVIFLGSVVGVRRNLHFKVTAGIKILPTKFQFVAQQIGEIILILFCIAITWHGIELVYSTVEVDFRLRSTGISMFWPYLIMPLSFGLQAIRLIYQMFHNYQKID